MIMCIQNLVKFCQFILKIWSKNLILESIKGRNSVANLRKKQRFTIPMLILSMMMCIQNLVLFCQFVLKILRKKQILTSIKGRNSVVNLRKQRFTILMLILSMIMCIQNFISICLFVLKKLSKNQILTSIKGRNSVANLRKPMIYKTNVDLVNVNVYTKFYLN